MHIQVMNSDLKTSRARQETENESSQAHSQTEWVQAGCAHVPLSATQKDVSMTV